ncbi:MAG: spermine synthase [Magnetococcales bacterium]|nr:spermine synthase [Magnetococcales bacterium]
MAATIPVFSNQQNRSRFWLVLLPMLSGYCGLGYEVLFGRVLGNHAGDQFVVSAAILITFLCGIGIGAAYAHRLWRWLWAIELAIGLSGVAFALGGGWIHAALYAPPLVLGKSLEGSILFLIALLSGPALLIGCTLPLMAGYLEHRLVGRHPFAQTYTLYNLGSTITIFFVEFFLVTQFGLRAALLFLACVNVLTATLLWFFFAWERCNPPVTQTRLPVPRYLAGSLILASMASAIFQLVVVKLTEFVFGPFRESFALVLIVVLLGLTLGSWGVQRLRWSYGVALFVAIVGVAWVLFSFSEIAALYADHHALFAAWGQPGAVFWKFVVLMLLAGAGATGFGALIPAMVTTHRHLAREAGEWLFISSLANTAGFLLMVFVLHAHLRYGEMLVVVGLLTIIAWGVDRTTPPDGRSLLLPLSSVLVLSAVLTGALQFFWQENNLFVGHRHYNSLKKLVHARKNLRHVESYTHGRDLLAIIWLEWKPYFLINGYISIPLDLATETLVGAYAAMHAPRLENALVLGVGSGKSAGAVARLFHHTDAVEINPAVLEQLPRMDPFNQNLSQVTHIRYILDDAIHFTQSCSQAYDLVVNTVTSPLYFSSSRLYTVDFLDAMLRCLAKDGVYMTWVDSRVGEQGIRIMLKTLESRFKYAGLAFVRSGYFLILASQEPVRVHHPDQVAREPVLANYFVQKLTTRAEWLPYGLLTTSPFDYVAKQDIPLNTLDRPVLEFAMARQAERGYDHFQAWLKSRMRLEEVQAVWNNPKTWNPAHLVLHARALGRESMFAERWAELAVEKDDRFKQHLAAGQALLEEQRR